MSRPVDPTPREAARDAAAAMWSAVAAAYPAVTTGDFPPDADFALMDAIETAIERWLDINAPEGGA